MKEFEVTKRDMFDASRFFIYKLVCDKNFTYKELVKALHKLDYDKNCIEEISGNPPEIAPYRLKDGREIRYILESIKREPNNKRWVIEWYEGVWLPTEPPVKKKKGFIQRETFCDPVNYTERLKELTLDDYYSPIIVGTYECEIINQNPERVDAL